MFLEKYAFEAKKMVRMDVWFPADMKTVLSLNALEKQLNSALHDIEQHFDAFVEKGLGGLSRRFYSFV